jgi:hypothetical protein
MEARSCNHRYSGKTLSITYSDYVSVVLGIQHAQHIHRVTRMLSSVAFQAVPYFSTLSNKSRIFGIKFLNVKCVFWISIQLLVEIFLVLIRIQRYIIINVSKSSCKMSVFNETELFSTDFRKNIQMSDFMKIRPVWKPNCAMRMERPTDTHDGVNSRFSQFCEEA